MNFSIMHELARTGQIISPLIPIVAGGLLLAGIIVFVASRVTLRKGSHRAPVAMAAAAPAVEPTELPSMGPGVDSPGSTLGP